MVTKGGYKNKEITSFEECATNIQRLLVDFFSNLVIPDFFHRNQNEKKSFDVFDNLLKKDFIFAKINQFISNEKK